MRILNQFILGLTVLACASTALCQGESSSSSERDRILALEARVLKLEQRLLAIESAIQRPSQAVETRTPPHEPAAREGDWRVLENWSRVRTGMSPDQVKKILGAPTSTKYLSERMGTWFYEGFLEEANAKVTGSVELGPEGTVYLVRRPVF